MLIVFPPMVSNSGLHLTQFSPSRQTLRPIELRLLCVLRAVLKFFSSFSSREYTCLRSSHGRRTSPRPSDVVARTRRHVSFPSRRIRPGGCALRLPPHPPRNPASFIRLR